MNLETVFDRIAGSTASTRAMLGITAGRLRILAYHAIDDQDAFSRQMEWLRRDLRPVDLHEVLSWLSTGSLPDRAVWVTFDDGDPSVVTAGLPVLEAYDIPSTMFLCPGVVDTATPYWWQVAIRAGMGDDEVARLKHLPDPERRRAISLLAERLQHDPGRTQITSAQIDRYISAGGTLGNHTWDHPCLDRCEPSEQTRQIEIAHRWIADRYPDQPLVFAYPNGNHTARSEEVLVRLGYQVAVLFDHRLAHASQHRLRLSRLRTDSTSTPDRFRSIAAGVHPAVHHLRLRVAGSGAGRTGRSHDRLG